MNKMLNPTFEITPYVGALPLRFGMTAEAVHALLGTPRNIAAIWNKTGFAHSWTNPSLSLGFSNENTLNHIGLSPSSYSVSLNGTCIWTRESCVDPNPILLRFDASPRECVGFLFYLELGIRTSGFHDDDPSQQALCVFTRGHIDELLPESRTPDLSRYRNLLRRTGG